MISSALTRAALVIGVATPRNAVPVRIVGENVRGIVRGIAAGMDDLADYILEQDERHARDTPAIFQSGEGVRLRRAPSILAATGEGGVESEGHALPLSVALFVVLLGHRQEVYGGRDRLRARGGRVSHGTPHLRLRRPASPPAPARSRQRRRAASRGRWARQTRPSGC